MFLFVLVLSEKALIASVLCWRFSFLCVIIRKVFHSFVRTFAIFRYFSMIKTDWKKNSKKYLIPFIQIPRMFLIRSKKFRDYYGNQIPLPSSVLHDYRIGIFYHHVFCFDNTLFFRCSNYKKNYFCVFHNRRIFT